MSIQQFRYTYRAFFVLIKLSAVMCGLGILVHLFAVSQDFHFNEGIWFRGRWHTLDNFWDHGTVTFYSLFHNLFVALFEKYTPHWGFFSHYPMAILYGLVIYLLFRFLRKKLKLEWWLCYLGAGFYITMPILSEPMLWMNGSHTFAGLLWLLLALNCSPSNENYDQWKRWILPGVCYLVMFTTSAISYPGFFLILLYLVIRSRKYPKNLALWFVFFLLGVGHILLRNYMLNDNMFVFAPSGSYGLETTFSVISFLEKLAEIIEYSNPIILLQRHVIQGHLTISEQNLANVLHLLWLLPSWAFILLRKNAVGWEIFLYGVGAVGTLLMASDPYSPRYFVTLGFVNSVGIVLVLYYTVHELQFFKKCVFIVLSLLVIGLNLQAKTKMQWYHWNLPKHMEQDMLSLAETLEAHKLPIVFLTHQSWKVWALDNPMFGGGSSATMTGLRRMLMYAGVSTCIYGGYRDVETLLEVENAALDNKLMDYYVVGINPSQYHCPVVLESMQEAFCFQHDLSIFPMGEFVQVSGVVQVPWLYQFYPEGQEGTQVLKKEVPVRCSNKKVVTSQF